MEADLVQLIKGSSQLAGQNIGFERGYWKFEKDYIEKNPVLLNFLRNNANLKTHDYQKPLDTSYILSREGDDGQLFEEKPDCFLIHDSARYLVYFFCINKLTPSISMLKGHVSKCEIVQHSGSNEYYYGCENVNKFEQEVYSGIEYPEALKYIIKRNIHIHTSVADGYILDLNALQKLSTAAKEHYMFSKIIEGYPN